MADQQANSTVETTKQRVERIDREYYKTPDRFFRWRQRMTLLALLLAIGWCGWGTFDQDRHYSPGPVADVHAMWENNCEACHAPFTPIRHDTWLSSAETQRLLDGKCISCHPGPPHHALEKPDEVMGCAACHADHHGRGASLVQVDDRQCTRCHADLNLHRIAAGAAPVRLPDNLATITRFDLAHPEFQLPKTDPGRLRFSHGRHMALGLNLGKDDRFPAWKWGDLPANERKRYQTHVAADDALVQLDCATCHRFESGSGAGGDHSLPIVYENHCAACHPLNYEPGHAVDDLAERLSEKRLTIPHGLPAEEIRDFLEARHAEAFLLQRKSLLESRVPAAPLPAAAESELRTVANQVREQVQRSATFLRGRCGECHLIEDKVLAARDGERKRAELWFSVTPTKVPHVWFTKARFDHAAHRALGCRDCHPAAYSSSPLPAGEPKSWADPMRLMLPGRETCLHCHAPLSATGGGARFDCAECHVYHKLDHPPTGPRAPAPDTAMDRTIEQFIRAEFK